jgi:hypothetical protein
METDEEIDVLSAAVQALCESFQKAVDTLITLLNQLLIEKPEPPARIAADVKKNAGRNRNKLSWTLDVPHQVRPRMRFHTAAGGG